MAPALYVRLRFLLSLPICSPCFALAVRCWLVDVRILPATALLPLRTMTKFFLRSFSLFVSPPACPSCSHRVSLRPVSMFTMRSILDVFSARASGASDKGSTAYSLTTAPSSALSSSACSLLRFSSCVLSVISSAFLLRKRGSIARSAWDARNFASSWKSSLVSTRRASSLPRMLVSCLARLTTVFSSVTGSASTSISSSSSSPSCSIAPLLAPPVGSSAFRPWIELPVLAAICAANAVAITSWRFCDIGAVTVLRIPDLFALFTFDRMPFAIV
mmetsp:Transcript_14127/g.31733  ORF Transcript_14127/g.31733 Transcript_14127/m.31733 type:complete len:274 (-) Transcript_14127:131-952(-)